MTETGIASKTVDRRTRPARRIRKLRGIRGDLVTDKTLSSIRLPSPSCSKYTRLIWAAIDSRNQWRQSGHHREGFVLHRLSVQAADGSRRGSECRCSISGLDASPEAKYLTRGRRDLTDIIMLSAKGSGQPAQTTKRNQTSQSRQVHRQALHLNLVSFSIEGIRQSLQLTPFPISDCLRRANRGYAPRSPNEMQNKCANPFLVTSFLVVRCSLTRKHALFNYLQTSVSSLE